MEILLIDNYDSFTFNVFQYLEELGNKVTCIRNDKITLQEIEKMNPDAIFISPGPGNPGTAGICLEVVRTFAGKISIFGICLGHQIIGEAFGARVIHAKALFHGKTSKIISLNKGVFENFPPTFIATRYHSLIVEKQSITNSLEVTCQTEDGEIMGLKHKEYNIEGVQFHPESIMTEVGKEILTAFLDRTQMIVNGKSNKEIINKTQPIYNLEKTTNLSVMNVTQTVSKFNCDISVIPVFEQIRKIYGNDACALLDSASGPEVDCSSSYIGIHPIYEIAIKNQEMEIITESKILKEHFIRVFSEFYNSEKQIFLLNELKFSEIFPMFVSAFKLIKEHEYALSFSNGLVGLFSYEYLHYIEKVNTRHKDVLGIPDIHLKCFNTILEYDEKKGQIFVIQNNIEQVDPREFDLINVINCAHKEKENMKVDRVVNDEKPTEMISNMTKEAFFEKVSKSKQYIKDGDIFQIQIGRRLQVKKQVNPFDIYKRLRIINPSPYMFYWDCKDYQLISNSPELQLKVENGDIMIRPIAGTSKGKGNNKEEALALKKELAENPKEQAEHIMLVDLARNDIGKIATTGSVNVTKLMKIEEFSHVFHIVSSVEGKILEDRNTMALFESTFPAGTLTGAPKIRAMQIINELEEEERGPYGGAFGFFDFNGNILSSIVIRTILRKEENLYLHASAGIVADSEDYLEWNEIKHKTETVLKVITGEI